MTVLAINKHTREPSARILTQESESAYAGSLASSGRGCQLFWKDCKETDDRGCPASGETGRYPVCECAVVPDGIPWHGRLPVTFVFSVNIKKPDVV